MPAKPRPLVDPRDLPAALGLLTRLPVKVNATHAMGRGAAAAWAWPVAGLTVGAAGALAGYLALALGLGPAIAAGLALGVQIAVTGALHEDGLADCADGFWGGWSRRQRLAIMKDSRIGSYGVLALILATGLRWSAMAALLSAGGWPWLLAAGGLSRAAMALVMGSLPRVRPGGLAARVGRPSVATVALSLGLGLLLALLSIGAAGIAATLTALAMALAVRAIARLRIGGQTGDVLGATAVLAETATLILGSAWI